jgi:cytochrome c553
MTANRTLCTALAAGLLLGAWARVASAEGDLEHGRSLYDLCQQCHGEAGHGNELFLAPAIAGLDEWYVLSQLQYFKNGVRGMHPDDVGGLRMYPMSLSLKNEGDIEAVAAYVASLPRVQPEATLEGGDPQAGQQRYALCASCHGPDGGGNEAMKAPRLAGASDWYLLSTLQKFKAGIRGANPGNPNGAVMRGFAGQLDDQAMLDLVAYIRTFSGSE